MRGDLPEVLIEALEVADEVQRAAVVRAMAPHDAALIARLGGRCVAEARLPGYPIARLRTGQFTNGGLLWMAAVANPPWAGRRMAAWQVAAGASAHGAAAVPRRRRSLNY